MATTKAFELAQLSALTDVDASGNVTTNTSQIANASGDLTLDSVADIILNADGADIILKDDTVDFGRFKRDAGDFVIKSETIDKNVIIKGTTTSNAVVTALTLDMANSGRATFSENVIITGTLTGVTDFNSSGDMNVGGDLTVTGDLTVEGNTVSLNTTTLDVEDKNITLNYHASNDTSASAGGAGITIQDAVDASNDASILWDTSADKFDFSHSIAVASTNPVLTLQDTDATATYNRTEFQNSGGGLNFNTRHSDGTFVSTDYQIGKNASGAVEHKWFIGTTARSRITSAGDAEWYEDNGGAPQVGMHWDYTDGYLGIGDTAPEAPLFINGNESGLNDLTPILWARSKTGASITQMNVQGDQIQFGGGATLDTSPTMTIDYGNNAVGIGETNPTTPLYIKGAAAYASGATDLADATTKAVARIRGSNDSSTSIWIGGLSNSKPYLQVANYNGSGSDGLIINPYGGNVGIGTETPQDELVVHSDSNPTISIIGSSYNDEIGIKFGGGDLVDALSDGNCGAQILSQQAVSSGQAKGDLQFKVNIGDSLQTAMFIGNDANVGVNTSQPFAKSHIKDIGWSTGAPYGTVQLIEGRATNDHNWSQLVVTDTDDTNGNGGAISFATGASTALNPFASIKGYREGANHGALDLYTRPNGGTSTRRMRIDSDGNVGIGTDSLTAKLNVHDDTTTTDSVTLLNRTSTAFGWEEEYWFNARVTATTAGTAYVTFQFSNPSSTNTHNMHVDYTFGLYREHPTLGSTEGDTVKGSGSYHNNSSGGDTARSGEAEVIGVSIVENVYIETTGTYAFRLGIDYVATSHVKNISGKIKLLNNPATGTSPAITVTV